MTFAFSFGNFKGQRFFEWLPPKPDAIDAGYRTCWVVRLPFLALCYTRWLPRELRQQSGIL